MGDAVGLHRATAASSGTVKKSERSIYVPCSMFEYNIVKLYVLYSFKGFNFSCSYFFILNVSSIKCNLLKAINSLLSLSKSSHSILPRVKTQYQCDTVSKGFLKLHVVCS